MDTPADRKRLVRRELDEGWGKGNVDVLDETCSGDVVLYGLPTSDHSRDLQAFKDFISHCCQAFPDLEMAVEDMVAEGDLVVARSTLVGTHDGCPSMHCEPAGASVEAAPTATYRIESGTVAENGRASIRSACCAGSMPSRRPRRPTTGSGSDRAMRRTPTSDAPPKATPLPRARVSG